MVKYKFILLHKMKDFCYYDLNGELVWVKNKRPYLERSNKGKIEHLKLKGELDG